MPPRQTSLKRWAAPVLVAVVVGVALNTFDARAALASIEGMGPLAPLMFVLLYTVSAIAVVPGSVLTFASGTLFGFAKGTLYASLGSTLGATAAFLVGRYLARPWVARKLETRQAFAAIDRAVAQEGGKIVGLTRLSPVLPYNVLNYAFSLTGVSLRSYVLATWAGMLPATVMYVYLGSMARAGIKAEARSPGEWTLLLIGLLATVGVSIWVAKIARSALHKNRPDPSA